MVKKLEQVEVGYCDTCGERSYASCGICGADICPGHSHFIKIQSGFQGTARPMTFRFDTCAKCVPKFWKAIKALEKEGGNEG